MHDDANFQNISLQKNKVEHAWTTIDQWILVKKEEMDGWTGIVFARRAPIRRRAQIVVLEKCSGSIETE
jgi:hypothetical protein